MSATEPPTRSPRFVVCWRHTSRTRVVECTSLTDECNGPTDIRFMGSEGIDTCFRENEVKTSSVTFARGDPLTAMSGLGTDARSGAVTVVSPVTIGFEAGGSLADFAPAVCGVGLDLIGSGADEGATGDFAAGADAGGGVPWVEGGAVAGVLAESVCGAVGGSLVAPVLDGAVFPELVFDPVAGGEEAVVELLVVELSGSD